MDIPKFLTDRDDWQEIVENIEEIQDLQEGIDSGLSKSLFVYLEEMLGGGITFSADNVDEINRLSKSYHGEVKFIYDLKNKEYLEFENKGIVLK